MTRDDFSELPVWPMFAFAALVILVPVGPWALLLIPAGLAVDAWRSRSDDI